MSKAKEFLALHRAPAPLLVLPNAWDAGSAKIVVSLGFAAVATTSSGHAATLGRPDGAVGRELALAHARMLVEAVDVPVSADLENCFADEPDAVADTIRAALALGLAGASVEDFTGRRDAPIYDLALAADRVRAAAEAAHAGGDGSLVLTARAENHLHDRADLADTIARLRAFQEAGADVVYAPGLSSADEIRAVVSSVDAPVNVLAMAGVPPVPELAELGVRRVSVGGSFAFAAYGGLVAAGRELLESGTYGYREAARVGQQAASASWS
ncbi:MAG TPA: isocitrate lyase/phosphoenolpyruvate mutase family protein [Nocardioidaceae bacterium]|nr:isocitrate lyase/phosphoenolpyruvate mutase family protein [Nocardioidaceae bacterium]